MINNEVEGVLHGSCTEVGGIASAVATDNATAPGKSKRIKRGRGGNRPGAGRKQNLAKRILKGFTRDTIAQAAADIDVGAVIVRLLKAKSERTRLETLAFLRDTLYGRPAQNVSLSGGVNVNMAVWRPLENLSDEEIQLLDSITKKINGTSQDGLQNQIESKPAIDAEVVESGAANEQRAGLIVQGGKD